MWAEDNFASPDFIEVHLNLDKPFRSYAIDYLPWSDLTVESNSRERDMAEAIDIKTWADHRLNCSILQERSESRDG